jgi:hypothetical protein
VGAALAVVVVRVLYPTVANVAADVIVPHPANEQETHREHS